MFKHDHIKIVDNGDFSDPKFSYRIDGNKGPEFGFTIKSIPEDSRDWLVKVVCRQLHEAYEFGRQEKSEEVRKLAQQMMSAVGIKTNG